MNVLSIIDDIPGDRPCIIFENQILYYGTLRGYAITLRQWLVKNDIGLGDRVALLLPNSPAFVTGYLAIVSLGAVAVSINATLTDSEIDFILADSGAKAIVTFAEQQDRLVHHSKPICVIALQPQARSADLLLDAVDVPDNHPAAIAYSSGTTGRPKGIALSHGNVAFTARSKVRYMGVTGADTLLLFLPLTHCFGQNAILMPALFAGATLVLHRRFDRDAVLTSLADHSVTMVFGVPTTFLALKDHVSHDAFPAIRYWFSAAAPLPREVEDLWPTLTGLPIHQGYGLTECSPFATYNHAYQIRPGSVGAAIDEVDLKIVDPETGADLAPGVAGEIILRGPNVMLGYWNNPDATAKAIRNGWLHTGDIGRLDADGYLSVEDRLTDLIIVGGRNVYPAEVENALYGHPAVAEAAVFGVADPFLGEEVWAHVVLKPSDMLDAAELEATCRRTLAAYKVPTSIAIVDALPRTPTGKILKRELRANAVRAVADVKPTASGTAPSLEAWLRAWLARHLNLVADDIDRNRAFADLGLDSVLGVSLARDLESDLNFPFEPTLVWEASTLGALIDLLKDARPETADPRGIPLTV